MVNHAFLYRCDNEERGRSDFLGLYFRQIHLKQDYYIVFY